MEGTQNKEMEQLIITAVYKLHLHCKECARSVHKSITSAPGILKVDIDMESGKVTVKGIFDANKLHEIIEKKSKRKVEWVSPKPAVEKDPKIDKMPNKEGSVRRTTHIKLRMHCEKCKEDVRNILLKHKGVESVKMDMKEQSCVIVGVFEEKKLLKYIHKRSGKRGKIIEQKQEKNNEAKEEEDVLPNNYLIHCTHAPLWFSDENPNACSLM